MLASKLIIQHLKMLKHRASGAAHGIEARKRALYDNEFMECPEEGQGGKWLESFAWLRSQGAKNGSQQYYLIVESHSYRY
jgi:hypothetical protein